MSIDDAQLPPHETMDDAVKQKHPRGLMTLFFTEMWERFSYYGMRALLVLFMTDQIMNGGLAMDDATATAIYGLYTAAVYLVALPGGWISDRILGMQSSVWYGGIVIMFGHFTLAIPTEWAFYTGLVLVILGTGLLKPTVSAIVGELYPEGGARRDAGFTIYYMGINLGAFLGPLICGYLGESETFGWHWGFGAAGVGMFFGLLQYKLTKHHLGDAGLVAPHALSDPAAQSAFAKKAWGGIAGAIAALAIVGIMAYTGSISIDAVGMSKWTTGVILTMAAAFFIFVFFFGDMTTDEKKRTGVIVILFFGIALFWSGFEQSGSSMNIFADRFTDRSVLGGFFDTGEHPATWYQSLNPIFIILLAPVFAWLWVELSKKMLEPSIPAKFGIGLVIMGSGFLVMYFAAGLALQGMPAAPIWLISTYFLHTAGELCISPVGLSATTKLAPKNYKSQMMGIWFLGAALGNVIAGLLAGEATGQGINPDIYMQIFLVSLGGGMVMIVFTKPIKKLMAGVQ